MEVLNYILFNEGLSNSQKIAVVTLIHKGGEKNNLRNWRPISLLCSDYKILAKVLTNSLKDVLPSIISKEQTGGVKGRKVTQNLNSYRNIIEYYSSHHNPAITKDNNDNHSNFNLGAALVSLDFEKAYDRVHLDFV